LSFAALFADFVARFEEHANIRLEL
jgi:hypothetical protein